MGFFDLRKQLAGLMPHAIQWAEATAEYAAMSGRALDAAEQALARRVGVAQPENIRLLAVDEMPYPEHPLLQAAAMAIDFLGPQSVGLALGHAVVVRRGHESTQLFSHEFRHVHQYEQAGSIAAFLPLYLGQMVEHGYADAPLEQDARAHEIAE